jgi:hypothetical protein
VGVGDQNPHRRRRPLGQYPDSYRGNRPEVRGRGGGGQRRGVEHAQVIKATGDGYKFDEHHDLKAKQQELIPDELARKCSSEGRCRT